VESRHEPKVKEGARPFLEEGEEILAAFVARPRGWTQSMAGARGLGAAQQGRAYAAAEQAEFRALAGAKTLAEAFDRAKDAGERPGAP
jgi:hypothetical protein